MNSIRVAGTELAANSNLFRCIDLALDLSQAREEEIEVFHDGVKVGVFASGRRVWPAIVESPDSLNLAAFEKRAIRQALEAAGSVPKAAKMLGIGVTTLYKKLGERQPPLAFNRAA